MSYIILYFVPYFQKIKMSSQGRPLSFPAAFLESLVAEEQRTAEEDRSPGRAMDPHKVEGRRHSVDSQLSCVDHVDGHTLRQVSCLEAKNVWWILFVFVFRIRKRSSGSGSCRKKMIKYGIH